MQTFSDLHKVEGILANSFLAMKIMMKHQVEKQVEEAIEIKKAKEKKEEENKKVAKDIKVSFNNNESCICICF